MENVAELNAIRIPLKNLTISEKKIREAQLDKKDYEKLGVAIEAVGIQVPIIVRPAKDPDTKKVIPDLYEICDGCQRHSHAQRLNHKTIPAIVTDLTDMELQGLQLMLNDARVGQSKGEVVKQLKRMMIEHNITKAQLAVLVGKDPQEIYNLTKLDELIPEALALLDKEDSPLGFVKALALARLPEEAQAEFLKPEKVNLKSEEFAAEVQREAKNIKKRSAGLTPDTGPIPKAQKKSWCEERIAKRVFEFETIEKSGKIDSIEYIVATALKQEWEEYFQIDPETLAAKKKAKEEKSTSADVEKLKKENQALKDKVEANDKALQAASDKAIAMGIG